jgi:6-phosphogluconolactonase
MREWDERRDIFIGKNSEEAIRFAVEHWVHSAERAIQARGRFAVALSGGTTPKEVYRRLSREKVDWKKIWLFWSDERAVPPTHPDSNYKMAMEAGFAEVPPNQIFRMKGEGDLQKNAADYRDLIHRTLDKHLFDLVMLGVGEDGHTASLFPRTAALHSNETVAANWIEEKKTWRLTLTFPCINQSRHSMILALGKAIVPKVLEAPIESPYPASKIGTPEHKALWILDTPTS